MEPTQQETKSSPSVAKPKRARASAPSDPKRADPLTKAEPFTRLAGQRDRVTALKRQLAAARTRLEDDIAECVSDKPGAMDWYDHPGVLTRAEAMEAGGVPSGVALHRSMERYRKRLASKPARERRKRGAA